MNHPFSALIICDLHTDYIIVPVDEATGLRQKGSAIVNLFLPALPVPVMDQDADIGRLQCEGGQRMTLGE